MQYQLKVINRARAISLHSDVGRNHPRQTEQDLGLIDQMRAEVEENSATGPFLFAPCVLPRFVSKPVEVTLIVNQTPQQLVGQEFLYRLEIAIPPAVVIDADQSVLPSCQINRLLRLRRRSCERFLDYHIFVRE